jgi:hypothetical protein
MQDLAYITKVWVAGCWMRQMCTAITWVNLNNLQAPKDGLQQDQDLEMGFTTAMVTAVASTQSDASLRASLQLCIPLYHLLNR